VSYGGLIGQASVTRARAVVSPVSRSLCLPIAGSLHSCGSVSASSVLVLATVA